MVKKLSYLVSSLEGEFSNFNELLGESLISGISFSSESINPAEIFVAIKGFKADGHDFVVQAFNRGAKFAVVENAAFLNDQPGIIVKNSRKALAILSSKFYDDPSSSMNMIGITGTNGKTTTNWITYHLLNLLGSSSLRLGTLGKEAILKNGKIVLADPNTLTTSDSVFLFSSLDQALELEVENCVMEVSSHALKQDRTFGIDFDVAVFTNLTQDHLDYHPTFEDYYSSKKILFESLVSSNKNKKTAIINTNCKYGERLALELSGMPIEIVTFSDDRSKAAERYSNIVISSISQTINGSTYNFEIDGRECIFSTSYIGHHNAENFCAAIAACRALGYQLESIKEMVPKVPQAPGRLEACGNSDIGIYVDYAHTPDALENVLRTVRPIVKNKLWVIFGCGGDRDRSKRPRMAEVSVRLADKAVLTSDNPRTEDPEFILSDVLREGHKPEMIEVDRRLAIKKTINQMEKGDVLVIAGKGHENYQIIGTTKEPFSDFEEVRKNLIN